MKRFSAVVLVTSLAWTLALPSPPWAQPKRVVTIASGAVDGVYFPIAGLMSRIASDAKDLNVRAVVASSGGAIANVQLIRAGEASSRTTSPTTRSTALRSKRSPASP